MPDDIKLPKWYMVLEKVATKLAAGAVVGEAFLQFSKSFIPKELFDIIHLVLIPFGIVCITLSGNHAIELLKKIKFNGK